MLNEGKRTHNKKIRVLYWISLSAALFLCSLFLGARSAAFFQQAWGLQADGLSLWLSGSLFFIVLLFWIRKHSVTAIPPSSYGSPVFLLFCAGGILLVFRLKKKFWADAVGEVSALLPGQLLPLILTGGGILFGLFLYLLAGEMASGIRSIAGRIRGWNRYDVLFLLGVLAVLNILIIIYAHSSRWIYFWDNAGYWKTASEMAGCFSVQGWRALAAGVYESVLHSDYNQIIALPFALTAGIFGGSRQVFLLSIVNLALFPVFLLIFSIVRMKTKRFMLISLLAFCALPLLWQLSALGFVDVMGCFFALAVMELLLSSGDDKGKYAVSMGFLLALLILLRRWYAFYSLTFLMVLILLSVFFRRYRTAALKSAASAAFTLLFFFQTFVSGILMADYKGMYEAYSLSFLTDLHIFFRYYGLLVPLLCLVMIGILILKKQFFSALFLLLQPVLCFFLFTHTQTHGQQHLLLYAPAMICSILHGITAIGEDRNRETEENGQTLSDRPELPVSRWEAAGRPVILAVVILTLISPALPREQPSSIEEIRGISILPSFSYAAPVRPDTDEILKMAEDLDRYGAEGLRVGILASSFTLNQDIILNAEDSLNVRQKIPIDRCSYLQFLPQVDGRDGFPDEVLECDLLVVAVPVQTHLGEEAQQCIALPAGLILEHRGIGAAFSKAEKPYLLQNGVKALIYRKNRDFTEEETADLRDRWAALYPEQRSPMQ